MSQIAHELHTRTQAGLLWAMLSQTPSMILLEQANADLPNIGVQTFAKQDILKNHKTPAKSYLVSAKTKDVNQLISILLDNFDDQMEIGHLITMRQASELLDKQLSNLNRCVLRSGGAVSHKLAEQHVHTEHK